MSGPDECVQAYVRYEILSYLDRHPHACDTVDGIVDWWLYRQRLHIGRAMVLTALDQLVESGRLDKRVLSSATVVYAKAGDSASEAPDTPSSPQPEKE